MTEEQIAMSPEDRLAANLCAECCADLSTIDATHHIATHWPAIMIPNGYNAEAIRRQQLMSQYAEAQVTKRREEAKTKASAAEHPSGARTQTTTAPPSSREPATGEKR